MTEDTTRIAEAPVAALRDAVDSHFDSCLRSHRDPDGLTEFADAIYAALQDRGYAPVPVASVERLRRIERAAEAMPGYHYESGRLDVHGEPGEPICGECDNDWPCPGSRLREALAPDATPEPES